MDPRHEVEQQQRIRGTEPQRAHRCHTAPPREAGQGPHDQRDAEQGEQPVHEDAGDNVFAGEERDLLAEPDESGPYGAEVSRQIFGTVLVRT